MNPQNEQLPVGLLAQLVEHCGGIAEVMGSTPPQVWIVLGLYFHLIALVVFITARIIHVIKSGRFVMTLLISHHVKWINLLLAATTTAMSLLSCSSLPNTIEISSHSFPMKTLLLSSEAAWMSHFSLVRIIIVPRANLLTNYSRCPSIIDTRLYFKLQTCSTDHSREESLPVAVRSGDGLKKSNQGKRWFKIPRSQGHYRHPS